MDFFIKKHKNIKSPKVFFENTTKKKKKVFTTPLTKKNFLRHIIAHNGFFAYREPTETIWIIYYRLLNLVEIIDYILLLVQWYKFSTDLY